MINHLTTSPRRATIVRLDEFRQQSAERIRHQELMALLLTQGRLPMVFRPRGR